MRGRFSCLTFVSWDRSKLPFCGGKQYGQDAVISKPNPVHFRSARTKMPVLQPLLELGCLSQMQTNKANSTNWLDVWAKLLYGFNGRWWRTRSKESHAHRSGHFCLMGQPQPPCTSSNEWPINLQLERKQSIVILYKYEWCNSYVLQKSR